MLYTGIDCHEKSSVVSTLDATCTRVREARAAAGVTLRPAERAEWDALRRHIETGATLIIRFDAAWAETLHTTGWFTEKITQWGGGADVSRIWPSLTAKLSSTANT